MKEEDINELFIYTIQSLLAAEKQVAEATPLIIEKAVHKSVKNALEHHQAESKKHITRLQKIGSQLIESKEKNARNTEQKAKEIFVGESKAAKGLLEEANEMLSLKTNKDKHDSVVVACMQKIEKYEISAYESALSFAVQLQLTEAEILLGETLHEEREASDLLTTLSLSFLDKTEEKKDDNNTISKGSKKKKNAVTITERSIQSPGGRAGTSHRQYGDGESRGH